MARLVLLIPVIAVLFIGTSLAYAPHNPNHQGGGGGSPPKVDIFARQVNDNSILVTWENPDDTDADIKFRYTISREVNKTDTFDPLLTIIRNTEETIIDTNGREMFFYLDEDIKAGSFYAYQIAAGRPTGNPNPVLSDDTRPIFIHPRIHFNQAESNGHLIQGRTLTPITPIISWFNWYEPFQEVQADPFIDDIFTTPLNPQGESYRLFLEPIPTPDLNLNCDQVLDFEYSRNTPDGQDFTVVTTILEKTITRDDNPPSYVIGEVIRNQKIFSEFTDSDSIKLKSYVIPAPNQTIANFSAIEIQYDISADFVLLPNDHRSLSFWNTRFLVPDGSNC
jgi:hypothetical protein